MTRFADFLEAYSGIVEIVKQADSQYGGLAYSTVSLLLLVSADLFFLQRYFRLSSKVAVNKSKREEKLKVHWTASGGSYPGSASFKD